MNVNSVLFQVLVLGISIAIGYLYVYPTFTEIGETQDAIVQYETELGNITAVNAQLANLVQRTNTLSSADRQKLDQYLPSTLDTIAIPRTIQIIADEVGVILNNIGPVAVRTTNQSGDEFGSAPQVAQFSVQVSGTYEQIKRLLRLLEQNEYPLEINELTLTNPDGGFIAADFTIIVYELSSADSV